MTAGGGSGDAGTRPANNVRGPRRGEEGTAAQLLNDLRGAVVELTAAGDKLRYRTVFGLRCRRIKWSCRPYWSWRLARVMSPPTVATEKAPPAPRLRGEVGTGKTLRIPLDDLVYGDFLARHKLRIVDGTAYPDGRSYRPAIYLADDVAEEGSAPISRCVVSPPGGPGGRAQTSDSLESPQ